MSSDAEDQIINELVQIKKQVININRGMSLSVAFGIMGASLIIGFVLSFLQVAMRR
jgi:hypothetical protein